MQDAVVGLAPASEPAQPARSLVVYGATARGIDGGTRLTLWRAPLSHFLRCLAAPKRDAACRTYVHKPCVSDPCTAARAPCPANASPHGASSPSSLLAIHRLQERSRIPRGTPTWGSAVACWPPAPPHCPHHSCVAQRAAAGGAAAAAAACAAHSTTDAIHRSERGPKRPHAREQDKGP